MGFTIRWEWDAGRTAATAHLEREGDPDPHDYFTLTATTSEAEILTASCRFATCAMGGIASETVQKELSAVSGQLRTPPPSRRIAKARFVRPDLFILSEVVGLSVPEMYVDGEDRPFGRWALYLQWRDGRRERRTDFNPIKMSDGSSLIFHPMPAAPAPDAVAGWSDESREAWLAGADAPDPVQVFGQLCEAIAHFVAIPKDDGGATAATLALWAWLSYFFPAWPAVPYLALGGAKGSGKTRVLQVLSLLVYRPIDSSSTTAACLFRTLNESGGVLLLDEAEQLSAPGGEAGDTLLILNSGYKSSGKATRLEKQADGTYRTIKFSTFGPKAIACIRGVPDVLASRCISLTMFRAAPGALQPKRRLNPDDTRWQTLRDDLHVLTLGPLGLAATQLATLDVSGLFNRDAELWGPLTALAHWLEERGADGLLQVVQSHGKNVVAENADTNTSEADEILLRTLAVNATGGLSITPSALLDSARREDPDTFRSWSTKGVSRAMGRYSIKVRKSGARRYEPDLKHLREVQQRYGIDLGLEEELDAFTPLQASNAPKAPTGPF